MIKKLHLTCKDKHNIDNEIWIKCIQKYREIYTDYEIVIYDNNDIYKIVEKKYPEYLEKIKQIKIGAVLADIFRYMILYLEGGIYSDMDCEPLRNINDLFTTTYFCGDGTVDNKYYVYPKNIELINTKCDFYNNPCNNCEFLNETYIKTYKCLGHKLENPKTILCYEFHIDWNSGDTTPTDELLLHDTNWTYKNACICQWFIITEPNQQIFLKTFMKCIENIDKLINLNESDENFHTDVIKYCGPLCFTKIVFDNMTEYIHILPSDFFCTGSWCGSVPLTSKSYIKHHFTGSWLK